MFARAPLQKLPQLSPLASGRTIPLPDDYCSSCGLLWSKQLVAPVMTSVGKKTASVRCLCQYSYTHRTLQQYSRASHTATRYKNPTPRPRNSSRVALCFWLLSSPQFLEVEEYHRGWRFTPDVAVVHVTG
jgi:hypothetical protein